VANIKSQIKRNRTNEASRVRNKAVRTALKTSAKKVRTEGDETMLRDASRAIDKAASKGVLHKRTAARRKSRLTKAVAASRQA
jgi:small subunit ribosomal protein S20